MKSKTWHLITLFFVFLSYSTFSATITSNGNGNWSTGSTWVGGVAPTSTDDVIIASGHTVNLTTNQTCLSLTINGTGILNMNTANRTLTISGNLTMNSTSSIQGSSTTRIVNVGGNFSVPASQTPTIQNIVFSVTGTTTINGTLTLNTGNTASKTFTGTFTVSSTGTFANTSQNVPITLGGSMVNNGTFNQGTGRVTFTGAASNTVTGTAATTAFGGGITVNKGTSQANVLDVQCVITMLSGGLTLTNGTFKLSSASTITPFTADPGTAGFPSTAQLWNNGGTMSASATTVTYAGAIQVSAGTLNIGTSADNYLFANGGSLTISGGAVNIAGELTDSATGTGTGMTFNMSNGICTVNTATGSSVDYPFYIDSNIAAGSTFTMTGGTLIIQNSSTFNTNAGYHNDAPTTFSGGTIQIGNSSTAASSTIGIETPRTIYNLTVNSSNVAAEIQTQAITIASDLTISSGSLTTNGFSMTVGGNWTNNGTFTNGSGAVTFSGTTQSITGLSSTTFYDLTLAGSGTKTYGVATFASNSLTINTGVVLNPGSIITHTAKQLTLGSSLQAPGTYGSTSSTATNQNNTFFTSGTSGIVTVSTRVYYTRQTGNWNSSTSWSTVTYGNTTNTGTFPAAGDEVNIGGAVTITVTSAAACGSLTFLINESAGNNTVTLNSGISLDVSGAVTIPRGTGGSGSVNTMAVGAGTFTAGSLAFTNGGVGQRHALTISTGTATISGDITQSGSTGSATITFTGAGTLNLGGASLTSSNSTFTASTGTVNYNGSSSQTMGDYTYNNLTLTNSGTKNPAGAMTIGGNFTMNSGAVFIAGGYTHTLTGNWTNNGATFTNTGGTFTFNGTSTQTIGGTSSTTFNNLTTSGSNTISFSLATTIGGTLTQGTGTVINPNSITTHTARTYIQGGTPQASGTFGSTSSSATNKSNTFFTAGTTGILTVSNRIYYTRQTGNWNSSTTWSTVTYGNTTNAGTFPVAGDDANIGGTVTITVNVNSACGSLSYQSGTNNTNTVNINSGITLAVSGAITIPRSTNPDINTLGVGAGTLTAGSLAFTNGGGGQRHVLTISTGTATITGDVTQSGSTGSATITFSGAGTLNVAGAFLNSSNCTFTRSTGTVNYNGTSFSQTVGDFTYYNLTINNTSSTIPQLALAGNTTATNTLTMTSGVANLAGFTLTLGSTGTASTLTRTSSTTTNWLYGGTFTRNWVTATAITSTSGNFYGLFPMGVSSASSYRPLEINSTVNPTASGTYSVTHTSATTTTDLSPTFSDAGTTVQRIDNNQFVGVTSGVTGGTYNISVTMTGLSSTGALTDIRLATFVSGTTATAVGTHASTTGTVSNPTASRTGLTVANLSNDFRIASSNSSATPLPIELISFSATFLSEEVHLRWSTASELNNDYFTIERSADGEKFDEIIQVKGKGTSVNTNHYEAYDLNPLYNMSYYRLKQTDFDGRHSYSNIIAIENSSRGLRMNVYPNPTINKHLYVEFSGSNARINVPIKVVNMQGTEVHKALYQADENGQVKALMELSHLAEGLYIVIINSSTGLQRKVILK